VDFYISLSDVTDSTLLNVLSESTHLSSILREAKIKSLELEKESKYGM